MNLSNLQCNYPLLLQHMRDGNYNPKYIGFIETEIKWILSHNNEKWESLKDACLERMSRLKEGNHSHVRAIFTIIERFIQAGAFPDGKCHGSVIAKSSYDKLTLGGEFKAIVDSYRVFASKTRTEKTLRSEISTVSAFLLSFESQNKYHLADITEEDVLNYFKTDGGKRIHGHGCKDQIAIVLKTCGDQGYTDCLRIRGYLPELKHRRKNIQYLNNEELESLKNTLYDMENCLSLRDRSIGLLLIFSGIRAIDIAQMKCYSIDWKRSSLSFIQEKTDQFVEIPMNAVTGNMIYDYITKERPDSESQYLFLPKSSHHKGHLSSNGIADIVKHLFKVAKIRQNPGDRQGTHIFRHHLATSLLENNVSCPVITSTLGHTSPASLEEYIRADFKHLKECSLSIDQFPVGNGVFGS